MHQLFIEERIKYDGNQLQPHWIYINYNLLGDAVIAFTGETHVPVKKRVDISDRMEREYIYSPHMLNFIIEHFNHDLNLAIHRQRLFIVVIKEELERLDINVTRIGDDLYVGKGKLSVSIATATPISTLIHVGVNIETYNTPVQTCGLEQLGVKDIKSFSEAVMLKYSNELDQIDEGRCKVRFINNSSLY